MYILMQDIPYQGYDFCLEGSLEDIKNYFKEIGYYVDPQDYFIFQTADVCIEDIITEARDAQPE